MKSIGLVAVGVLFGLVGRVVAEEIRMPDAVGYIMAAAYGKVNDEWKPIRLDPKSGAVIAKCLPAEKEDAK